MSLRDLPIESESSPQVDTSAAQERYRDLLIDGRVSPNDVRVLQKLPLEERDAVLDMLERLSRNLRRVDA